MENELVSLLVNMLMGIMSVAPKPNSSKKGKAHKIYPYLFKNLLIDKPNQVFCTDITYLRMHGGFVYLVAVMDWYSRKILSWEVSSLQLDFMVFLTSFLYLKIYFLA